MHAFDLRAKKSGKLMAMSPTEKRRGNKVIWDCVCACGRHRLVPSTKFVRQLITGCLDCDPLGRPRTRLGLSATGEYAAWQTARHGWPDFQEFLRALGLRPEGYEIGRLDPKKPHGYRKYRLGSCPSPRRKALRAARSLVRHPYSR